MSFSVYSSIVNLDTLNFHSKIPGTPVTTSISLVANTLTEIVTTNANSKGRTIFINNYGNTNVNLVFDPTVTDDPNIAFSIRPGDTICLSWGRTNLRVITESATNIIVTVIEYIQDS